MLPVQITLQDLPGSAALEDHIRKKATKLEHFYQHINKCRITISMPQKHKHQGKLYSVVVDITVPGKQELVASRKLDEDVYIAIRNAFYAMQRQLNGYARKRRGEVKFHSNGNRKAFKEEDFLSE